MKTTFTIVILAVVVIQSSYGEDADIRNCTKSPPYYPNTVVRTQDRVDKLRTLMQKKNLDSYIIPSTDAHGSEYVRTRDKRREYISGFSGSAGSAVVTMKNGSALWTDGRYFLQAEMELDCNWQLMRGGEKNVPTMTKWLEMVLKSGDRVGIDPFLISISSWNKMSKDLEDKNVTLVEVRENLVDQIWTNRPPEEAKKVAVQEYQYTGKYWVEKVKDVQKEMKKVDASAHVVQELDSIAWLLNLRGEEIPYNPVFFAYVIVTVDDVLFFVNETKISSMDVQKHLKISDCSGKKYCIKTKPYDSIVKEIKALSAKADAKIWLSAKDSHALRSDVLDDKVYMDWSPIRLMKGKKNEVELKGMINANLKDSVALTEFFMYAEEQVKEKANVTELSLEKKMREFRGKQALYRGLSFPSIIGFGPNGAVIHYRATQETNRQVTDKSTLLVDTGSQYLDGSTDVTRTVHFGTPTDRQKSAFTRVLMGQIDLAMAVFPQGTYGRVVDILARQPLFKNGWNYRHGTGHGIGSYLYIHEGPGRITSGWPAAYEKPLEIGFVLSDEPGYYENGNFGIRLETAVVVANASTPNRFNDVDYYTFQPITYFPIQRKLIDETIMSDRQLKWINNYHDETAKRVGEELKKQDKTKEHDWLMKQTKPIFRKGYYVTCDATAAMKSISLIFITAVVTHLFIQMF